MVAQPGPSGEGARLEEKMVNLLVGVLNLRCHLSQLTGQAGGLDMSRKTNTDFLVNSVAS